MARAPTTFSRVSTGYKDSKNTIAEAGYDLSCIDLYVAGSVTNAGAGTFSSTVSAAGAATFQSTVTTRGTLTAQSLKVQSLATFSGVTTAGLTASVLTAQDGIAVGTGGRLTEVSSVTGAISLGAIAPLESSSIVTVAVSGLTRGNTLILTLDSLYASVAANRDVSVFASSGSTTGEASVWGVNSTLTSVTPTAGTVIRLTRIAHPTYL